MNCRLCRSADLSPVPFDVPASEGVWFRCAACGSDSNALGYDATMYSQQYFDTHAADSGDELRMMEQVKSNCEWFDRHHHVKLGRDFLDVGCADGSALRVMQGMGWSVHGFDVSAPRYAGEHVTVAPFFHRWLFPRRYAAVLCREVIEHVEFPDAMLHELHGVTLGNGLVQIQTPQPCDYYHAAVYQRAHLFVASPQRLQAMIAAAMMDVLDSKLWHEVQPGQAYLCRAKR